MVAPSPSTNSPIAFPGTKQSDTPTVRRAASQAERIIQEERLTGADATRVRGLVEQAKSRDAEGNGADAERLARQALRSARSATGGMLAGVSDDEPTGVAENAAPVQANADGDTYEPLERETTAYSDASSDGGVSFQGSVPLTPAQAPLAIAEHETSHLRRRSRDATLNGQKVMQSIRYIYRLDPESGEIRIAGGRARTIVFPKKELPDLENVRENVRNRLDVEA